MCCEREELPYFDGCFACGIDNQCGLKLKFEYDRETGKVYSEVILKDIYAGYENIIHGGIVSTVLDETMAWTAIKTSQSLCLTRELRVKFHLPVRAGERYISEGSVSRDLGNELTLIAKITDKTGKVYAEAEALFMKMTGRRSAMMMEKQRRHKNDF